MLMHSILREGHSRHCGEANCRCEGLMCCILLNDSTSIHDFKVEKKSKVVKKQ